MKGNFHQSILDPGISIREYAAVQFMAALIASPHRVASADYAIEQADILIKKLEENINETNNNKTGE
jgi:hypothetical protein